jgi:chromosome segregation ATPase
VAFYYALRDTLYCKDSNLANKIAYDPSNRRRVVTYAQNRTIRVIEMNGTMSSNRIRQGLLANKGKGKKGEFDDKDVMKLEADR